MVTAETLSSGLRLTTEAMPHVRSVSVGVWLKRGSRHETDAESGVAHFVEHMLFKGTFTRTAQQIAQTIDSIGGQLDAFTSKEYAGYYIKVLDEHLPLAIDLLSDMVMHPALAPADIAREQSVILEEIKMVEDAPDDLVHEVFAEQFWARHPLGRPILGTPETVSSFTSEGLRRYFEQTYLAPNLIVAAAGRIEHAGVRALIERAFERLPTAAAPAVDVPPAITPGVVVREKDIEQSHVCLGTAAYPQAHADRHALYVLNTILGGSMSSRLFQHIREDRGLAYSVWSSLMAFSDAGAMTIYAGCATDRVEEVVDLTIAELAGLRATPVPADELQRAKDHLKGSLMLSLENTSSRMSQLAKQELTFGRQFTLDEILGSIDAVSASDVQRVASDLFKDGAVVATVVGPALPKALTAAQLRI
ncbi:MAG TPA: pitrilysin family protein [Vicinamibacterales bacterium]|jgi:predicted Zn-dependent peptidase|nr:pitrilysin family protein [Vicinamibacterales bacterium]HWB29932.1 pitrilysin family protein [Vicinamibacterales bacterium]